MPTTVPGIPDTDVTLRDGRVVHLRAMRPSDESELLQAFERMGPDARYMRFMRAVREPNMPRLRRTLASLGQTMVGILATVPAADGFDIAGSAVFVIGNDPSTCEFAISVAADYGGAGLGRTLMTSLIDFARGHALHEMEGFVLASNQPMLRLAKGLGFSIARDPEDGTVQICRLRLGDPQPGSATGPATTRGIAP